jgi:DNA-binding transcriptional MerR regulator
MDEKPTYRVKELAELAKVTVRTLHHYDRLGLLVPAKRSTSGYRLYGENDVLRLQQILIYRELGLPLEQIRRTLDDPEFDLREALVRQRERLSQQANHASAMIRSVDAALIRIEGDTTMGAKDIFEGFEPEEHEPEVRERWGATEAYKESARRTARYTDDDWRRIKAENEDLMQRFASCLATGEQADSGAAMDLAEAHRMHFDRWYYPCSRFMHAGLAEMYTADARFAESFEHHAEGLAVFVADAIRANARR